MRISVQIGDGEDCPKGPPISVSIFDAVGRQVCIDYVSAVKTLTGVATTAAAPSVPRRPLIFRQDARQPVSRASLTTSVTGGKANREGVLQTTDFFEEEATVRGERFGGTRTTGGQSEDLHTDRGGRHHGRLVVDAVLTSPPYPGVYDYLSHARLARSKLGRLSESPASVDNDTSCLGGGLGSSDTSLFVESPVPRGRNWGSEWTDGEVGAMSEARRRRRSEAFSQEASTRNKWESDQEDWLRATTSALRAGGRLGIMIGDGDGIDTRSSLLRTVGLLDRQNDVASLGVVGWATLRAAKGARRSMRTEHLVLLEIS